MLIYSIKMFSFFGKLWKKKEPEPLPENPRKEAYSLVCKIGYKNMSPDEFKKLQKILKETTKKPF